MDKQQVGRNGDFGIRAWRTVVYILILKSPLVKINTSTFYFKKRCIMNFYYLKYVPPCLCKCANVFVPSSASRALLAAAEAVGPVLLSAFAVQAHRVSGAASCKLACQELFPFLVLLTIPFGRT